MSDEQKSCRLSKGDLISGRCQNVFSEKPGGQIDDKERERFTVLMTKLLENVYIGKLESYSGQDDRVCRRNG